jgi:hypothetical protein
MNMSGARGTTLGSPSPSGTTPPGDQSQAAWAGQVTDATSRRVFGFASGEDFFHPALRRNRPRRWDMLLMLALLALILFGGLGFAAHILWLGLLVGVILAIAHVVTGGLTRT